jgi:hypothetical protein
VKWTYFWAVFAGLTLGWGMFFPPNQPAWGEAALLIIGKFSLVFGLIGAHLSCGHKQTRESER